MNSSKYYIGIALVLVAAVVIVVITQQEEQPQEPMTENGMPPGHPPIDGEMPGGEGEPGKMNVRREFLDTLNAVRGRVDSRPETDTAEVLVLARMLYDSHQIDASIPYFERFVRLAPGHLDSHIDLSVAYFETKQYDQALKMTNTVLKKDPDNTIAMYNLGVINHIQDKPDEAKRIWKKLIEKYPDSPDAQRAENLMNSMTN